MALALIWGWLVFFRIGLLDHWWFEDDPVMYAHAAAAKNPLQFFERGDRAEPVQGTNEVIPPQYGSFWLDAQISQESPRFAYLYQAGDFLVAAFLLYLTTSRYLGSRGLALLLAATWLFLPSSIAVLEFLATRCYVEGLIAALLANLCVQELCTGAWQQRPGPLALLFGLCLFAAVSKEFYPSSLLALAFLQLAWARRWHALAVVVGVGITYALYRGWMVGYSLDYGMPTLSLTDFGEFLLRLPYYLAGNWLGYATAAALVGLGLWVYRKVPGQRPLLLAGIILMALAIATLFPIAFALRSAWSEHGTYYRSVFVLNTFAIVYLWRLTAIGLPRYAGVLVQAVVIIGVISGANTAIDHWQQMKQHYQAEGHFFIEGKGQTLISTLPASWFLPGLAKLYRAHGPAFAQVLLAADSADPAGFAQQGVTWQYDGHTVQKRPLTAARTRADRNL